MLAVYCLFLCHTEDAQFTSQQYLWYHVHITFVWPDFHIGGKAAKPVTAVQDRVSTFACATVLFWWGTMAFRHLTLWHNWIFLRRPQKLSSCVCGNNNRYFKPKRDLFLTLNKWPNQTVTATSSTQETEPKECTLATFFLAIGVIYQWEKLAFDNQVLTYHMWFCQLIPLSGLLIMTESNRYKKFSFL